MTHSAAHNISLLFVEDNDTIRFLYNKLLVGKVRSFYLAENGQEGLALYRLHQPDLIITDISMPVMDGLQMISHIKSENPEVKVVVMSAYSIKEYFLEAINLGVNGYLIKPVEASRIFSIIADLAGQILMRRQLDEKENHRRQAEESLKRSLGEKDILLREVHHRVKNNMQIITSILRMQQRQMSDPMMIAALEESQNRIRSLALIHENLYRNENLGSILFSNYATSLANNLARSFADQQGRVSFRFNIPEVYLPLDIGIPCGLIINELISNAFKYAFAEMEKGVITITLKQDADKRYHLIVHDNGQGLPPDKPMEKKGSLGMKIIKTLAQQIGGTLTYEYCDGAKFTIDFQI
ncbi:MAG: response regulator [Clostridia bacterium]|nr:response regulator [Clostridia bacterium]